MSSRTAGQETFAGLSLKTLSLTLLALQNSSLILFMHYSRIQPLVNGRRYIPSTCVLASEVLKFTVSSTMALYEHHSKLQNAPVTTLFSNLLQSIFSGDSWKLGIPALLYTLQNSLQYIAASHLDASTLQITYQLKILTTALFSVLLLRRKLSARKWASLLLLAAGVTFVQVPLATLAADLESLRGVGSGGSWLPKTFNSWMGTDRIADVPGGIHKRSATYQGIDEDYRLRHPRLNSTIGLLAVLVACITSGLAGVYFEMILKDNSRGRQPLDGDRSSAASVWVRNTQLSFYSLFPALFIGVIFNDGAEISRYGFLAGWNWVVYVVVLLQAFGGILVSLVIKYADNIAKNFSTSIGIIISFIISFLFLDLEPSFGYILGGAMVIGATWLYNSQQAPSVPPILINGYQDDEKASLTPELGYFDDAPSRTSRSKSKKEQGLSTSRTSSPSGVRTSSHRRQYHVKRDA